MDRLADAVARAIAPLGMTAAASGVVAGPKAATGNPFHFTNWPDFWIDLYRDEDFVARVKEITGGAGVPVVYDGVGKDTFMRSLDCLRPCGLGVCFGNASGPVEKFDLGLLSAKGSLFVTRPTLMTYTRTRQLLLACAEDLMQVVKSGAVTIEIHQRFPLAQAADAHRALEGRATTGSTLLIP